MPVQIRRLTPNEKTGAISAFGGLRECSIGECEDAAEYIAVVLLHYSYLCERHKCELEQMISEKESLKRGDQ